MRVRTNIILPEDLLAKIDAIAGEKQRRSVIIETALREYISREESKASGDNDMKVSGEKVVSRKR